MSEKATATKKLGSAKNISSSPARKVGSVIRLHSPLNQVINLHQTFGNQAVQRLYKAGRLQAALKISHPNDIYEQEADRVADQVMQVPTPSLSRKCSSCGGKVEDLDIRRKPELDTSESSVPDNYVSSLGVGQPLDKTTRAYFEPCFGMDFGHVRVHSGSSAAQSASSINALAYTLGNNVVFGAGQYRPNTIQGKRLLAHELTHVVQQQRRVDSQTKALSSNEVGNSSLVQRSPAQPSVTHGPFGIYRAIETYCLAPSELPSISAQQASSFGKIVEVPIVMDYCAATGGCAWMATDYMDTDAASYIAFLAAHNPHLTAKDILELAVAATVTGGVSRPDVLTHKPPRFEFEEIKPDSVSGRTAGYIKLAVLATQFARFSLPYLPGVTWPGTGRLPLFSLPGGVDVFLQWHRNRPGLVVYNICVRGEASVLAAYGVLAILIAAILIILSRGQILKGAPIPAFASAGGPAMVQPGMPEAPKQAPVAQNGLA